LLEPSGSQVDITTNKPGNSPESLQLYRRLLGWALSNRSQTLLIGVIFFLFSLQLFAYVPYNLIDSGDTSLSTVYIELPPGAKLQETEAIANRMSGLIQSNSAVEEVLATTGNNNQINHATIYVKLKPESERNVTQTEFEQQTRQSFDSIPGAKISFDNRGVALGHKDIWLTLKSDEINSLEQAASQLENQMQQLPNLVEVSSSKNLIKPEIIIEPDTDRAADLGVSVSAIANTAALALVGDLDSNLAQFDLSDRQIPIRVQLDPNERKDINTIRNLNVPSSYGTLVPLSAVADIRIVSGPVKIERLDRTRQISLKANLENLALGTGYAQVRSLPAAFSLPSEVTLAPAPKGEIQVMREIFQRFVTAIALGIVAIYAILILLYNNFLYPFAILAALPISLGGALLALLLTDKNLGLFALIGIILLTGLVTKNAILLVDFALVEVKNQKPVEEAVTLAGTSRLRAIMMTSASTVAGMVPIALGFGADGEVRAPMAIAVIGGFSISTVLTLIIVPVMFTYIHRLVVEFKRRRHRYKR
jgi:multidrug efflux pump subunit AcrB